MQIPTLERSVVKAFYLYFFYNYLIHYNKSFLKMVVFSPKIFQIVIVKVYCFK